jgi:hypothetical protein
MCVTDIIDSIDFFHNRFISGDLLIFEAGDELVHSCTAHLEIPNELDNRLFSHGFRIFL